VDMMDRKNAGEWGLALPVHLVHCDHSGLPPPPTGVARGECRVKTWGLWDSQDLSDARMGFVPIGGHSRAFAGSLR